MEDWERVTEGMRERMTERERRRGEVGQMSNNKNRPIIA